MLWLLIDTQSTKIAGQFLLVVILFSLENLVKLRSQSVCFARELSDIIFKCNLHEPRFGHSCYILLSCRW